MNSEDTIIFLSFLNQTITGGFILSKEENLLQELCGTDVKLHEVLSNMLFEDPMMAIPERDLESLIQEAENNFKDNKYEMAQKYYTMAIDKAFLEAAQNSQEKDRYSKIIQDLASKIVQVIEKTKITAKKEGLTSKVGLLDRKIEQFNFVDERIKDVMTVTSDYYREKLILLDEKDRRKKRQEERQRAKTDGRRIEEELQEMRENRKKERQQMGSKERQEAEREEKLIEKQEMEQREARRKKRRKTEREEKLIEKQEMEQREARRKKRRKTE
jgi:hypothetical protein